MSDIVRDSIVVGADIDTVLEIVADFAAYPQWQDDVKAAEVLETDEDGWGTKARFTIDARVQTVHAVLAYEYTDTTMSWHLVESPQLERNDGRYELRDIGDGSTEVTYQVEITPKFKVPAMLRRQAARKVVEGALQALKRRVESA